MSAAEGWGTLSEKRFIDGIGRHSLLAADRVQLLRNYIDSMSRRYRWGSIDRHAIEAYTARLLQIHAGEGAIRG